MRTGECAGRMRDGRSVTMRDEKMVADLPENIRVMCFATHGDDHLDAQRIRYLLEPLRPEVYAFDYDRKIASALGLLKAVLERRPNLIVMEGTGVAGGVTLIALNAVLGVPFVLSSGDAVVSDGTVRVSSSSRNSAAFRGRGNFPHARDTARNRRSQS